MIRRTRIVLLAALVAVGSLTGCDGLLNTSPRQSVPPEVATSSIVGLRSLLNGVYHAQMHQDLYGNRLLLLPDVMADNVIRGPVPSGRYGAEVTNVMRAGIMDHVSYQWSYIAINRANTLIEGARALQVPESDQPAVDRLIGEAMVLRALAYHNLARTYAYDPTNPRLPGWNEGVVLRIQATTDVTSADDFRPRSTVEQTYQQIESDLLDAIEILARFPAAAHTDRARVNIHAARGLLSRVYLYWGKWEQAEAMATEALAGTGAVIANRAALATAYATTPNPESMLQFNMAITEHHPQTGFNGSLHAYTQPSSAVSWGDVVIAPGLVALFEEGDTRRQLFRNVGGTWYTNKYRAWIGTQTDHLPVLRRPEVLLNRAEARARMGRATDALTDLNTLRTAREASSVEASGQALIEAILMERRMELHFEGHRWYDLKRTGQQVPKEQPGVAPVNPEDVRMLAPLPQRDIDNTGGIVKQNPGY
jgi:starch-binding outer membrane protein, SusD/RagB family